TAGDSRRTRWQKDWISRLEETETAADPWAAFQRTLSELTESLKPAPEGAKKSAPPRKKPVHGRGGAHRGRRGRGGRPFTSRRPQYDPDEARMLQQLYRRDAKKAMRTIRGESSPFCTIDPTTIVEYFSEVYSPRDGSAGPPPFPEAGFGPRHCQPPGLSVPPTPMEVERVLRRCPNTAPGPDGVSYATWRRRDAGGHVLARIFELCLKYGQFPEAWKRSNTILIFKKGDPTDLSNWRPIALSDCAGKVLCSILADRLGKWAARTSLLSWEQKGFTQAEGCLEHNFVLQECIEDAGQRGSEICVAWLDLANAFGSVPHLSVLSALRRAGLAQDETSLIQDLYSSSATRVRHADGFTEPIRFGAGVRQGCPLSPVLFNIVMEAIIRTAKIGNQGYPLRGTPVSVLCYADDAVLVAPDPTTLQQMLDRVVTTADWLGLKFKPSKCASLHVKAKKTLRTDFQVGGATIHALNQGESYQHLGVPTGFRVDATPRAAAERLEEEALKVLGSLLAPWQKIHALKTFILPQLDFSLRTARVRKTAFKNLDRAIVQGVKDVFSLPQRAGAELVYLPPSWGGAGILSLEHYIDICSLCHAFQLLTCPDPVVASLALSGLSIAAKHKMRLGRGATPAEGAAYLTGGGEAMSGLASSVWSCARAATLRLQATIPELRWEYCEARESFEIHLPGLKQPVKIEAASRSRLSSSLRLAVQLFFQRRLHGKPDQGRTPRVSTMNAVSNHFLYDGRYTRFADWRFIFRARLGVLPINGCMRWRQDPAARRCRRGCAFDETTAHVLNHCPASLAAGTRRHNAVLSRLEAALKEKKNIIVRVNQQVPFDLLTPGVLPGQNIVRQRPDLVVINQAERRISYVD
ncbi:hypothetical protein KUF71_025853, partial [Frankliniella fusca]